MKLELLAPAGSYEAMKAAYAAGADAVYIGGEKFGARAFADNLNEEQMKRAIDYGHLKGRKLFLTVNTLVKMSEMDELYHYLLPFYREGLDAVIVQDMGVLEFVRDYFPGMDIHASTQMTVTGPFGAALLKEAGASRIVTPRELSLEEIRSIHDVCDIEIETFVHGALCYCYSGQCTYSSIIGGRSGNRGRCAQPCRLPYDLLGVTGSGKEQGRFRLSPKDMCALDLLPELAEGGVYSFKIEGRMKRPEYTAGVVSIYRRYLDRYLTEGRFNVSQEDRTSLLDLYNRGGFTSGYFHCQNGPEMMSVDRPNHWGTEGARVVGLNKNEIKLKALELLNPQDVLEYRDSEKPVEFTVGQTVPPGKLFLAKFKFPGKISADTLIYRTKNQALLDNLASQYMKERYPEKINGKLIFSREKSVILFLYFGDVQVEVEGPLPQQAKNRPLTQADVEKQLRKSGGTEFVFDHLEIHMDPDLFLPLQALNELRRNGIDCLTEAVLNRYRRESPWKEPKEEKAKETEFAEKSSFPIHVSLEEREVFPDLLEIPEIARIYLDCSAFENQKDFLIEAGNCIDSCRKASKECFYIMPWIFRKKALEYYSGKKALEMLKLFDGILIKSLDQYYFLKDNGYSGEIMTDFNLYTWNREALSFWRSRGVRQDTLPFELNIRELSERGCEDSELIVYGYIPLMVSAQCQLKNSLGCTGEKRTLYLKDRKQKCFAVKNDCSFCYSKIYNSAPLELLEHSRDMERLAPRSLRLMFTLEERKSILEKIHSYIRVFAKGEEPMGKPEDFTRGHFKRGVE